MPLHLGISALRLMGVQTGVARYLASLLNEWAEDSQPFDRITLFAPSPVAASSHFDQVIGGERWPRALWEQCWLPWQALRADVDCLFCPSNTLPLGYPGPSVLTLHDMLLETLPEEFPWSGRLRFSLLHRLSARRATRLLTDSESCRWEINQIYNLPIERITTVPLASAACFSETEPIPTDLVGRLGLDGRPFILFVGKFSPRRNLPALIAGFGQLVREHGLPHCLVLAGPNHRALPVAELAQQAGVVDRVVTTNFISDQELAGLYQLAELFVYPSEMEGFGLPILEAMACGTPVVTLRRSVLVEVGGEAACYIDTATPATLAAAMWRVIGDPAYRLELEQRGRRRAATFSWRSTAQQTMTILSGVARSGTNRRRRREQVFYTADK